MAQSSYSITIKDQTERALWEVGNVIDCVPDSLWDTSYCGMPLWKHIYHVLHSMDQWFINPRDKNFKEPNIHRPNLNNLDVNTEHRLSRSDITAYYQDISKKITAYLDGLNDDMLTQNPEHCQYTRFTLILAQHRHLHTHMGMLMGFIVAATHEWPRVIGLEGSIPSGEYDKFF